MINKIIFKNINNKIKIFKINNINFFDFLFQKSIYYNLLKYKLFCKYKYYTFNFFWARFVWRGKAYRVRLFKKKKKFILNFGHSHWLRLLYYNNVYFNRRKRQHYFFIYSQKKQTLILFHLINKLRSMDKYTWRGIRIKTTPNIKRFGKVSQNISSLHDFN